MKVKIKARPRLGLPRPYWLGQVMADHPGWESEAAELEERLTRLAAKVGKGFVILKAVTCKGVEQVQFKTASSSLYNAFRADRS